MRCTLAVASLLTTLAAGAACSVELGAIPEGYDPETAPESCTGKCDGPGGAAALAALPTATVATLFAPYEPALGLDLLLIGEVVAARAADPAAYAEGANPYRIRYAAYNLRNPDIAGALADAEDAGVDVQVLIEQDQLDPARDWNVTDEMLVARGFELVGDHDDLDDATRATADLIGVSGSGLMHLKARLYEWPGNRRVVTGSMNPGDLAVNNDETLHYLDDPAVFDAYAGKYEAIRDGRRVTNRWTDGAAVNVLFSPDGGVQAADRIAALIDGEDELILLAVYSLRNVAPRAGGPGIVERLVAAHARGVTVVVVTDRKQSDGIDADGNPVYYDDGTEDLLRDAGIPVYEVINRYSPFNAMHTKYGVFGLTRPIVVTDAGNWTRAGLGNGGSKPRNDESVLFLDAMAIDGGATAQRYLGNFLDIVQRYGADAATGGPSPAELVAQLQALPGWPTVALPLEAVAHTFWGQRVYVTGELDALGDWTRAGLGVPLSTNASSYPTWRGETPALPFGTRARYKLVKVSDDRVEWERGDDRILIADPTDARATAPIDYR